MDTLNSGDITGFPRQALRFDKDQLFLEMDRQFASDPGGRKTGAEQLSKSVELSEACR